MHVTMVKKVLANGQPCEKCVLAERRLRERGVWDEIDTVVIADERDPESPGWSLARAHGVELAPFWVVDYPGTEGVDVITSVLKLGRVLAGVEDTVSGKIADLAPSDATQVEQVTRALKSASPLEVIGWALMTYGPDCSIAFSGAEDVVTIDLAKRTGYSFNVFVLDTGRLHPETYEYIERVRLHYNLDLHVLSPHSSLLRDFVRDNGLFSFMRDGHKECCGVRKVAPLRRHLGIQRAWLTGQRRDQSPTRAEVPLVQADDGFDGAGPNRLLVKVNPLANWDAQQMWDHIRANNVPYNPLHDRGFRSIGCAPCTRPTNPGEHERAGRWWWEEATQKECGLHLGNLDDR